MADINQIFTDIKNQLGPLAEQNLGEFAAQGKADAEAFLADSRANLAKWFQQLADGKIDQDEFNFLVDTQKDAAEMTALRATNAGQIRVDKFRNSVFSVIISTAVKAIV
jgi:hypothetical protein